jgi:uncharacterized membrane protein
MTKGRLEAFSDGVFAIIITIMVLELKVPHSPEPEALLPLVPVALSYLLSYIFLGIYWTNHHHLLQSIRHVSGGVLWANLHLLFWLSLIPFVTAWTGENHFAAGTAALYGAVMLFCGVAYYILTRVLISLHGTDSALAAAVGRDVKGIISVVIYLAGVILSWVSPWISFALYVAVAIMWLIPDRRIEKRLVEEG